MEETELDTPNRSFVLLIVALLALAVGAVLVYTFVIDPFIKEANKNATQTVASQIAQPIDTADAIAVQSDVRATVINATSYFGMDPTADPAGLKIVISGKDTVMVGGNGVNGYQVVGTDLKTGYTYTYNSNTQQYTSTQLTPANQG